MGVNQVHESPNQSSKVLASIDGATRDNQLKREFSEFGNPRHADFDVKEARKNRGSSSNNNNNTNQA